MYDIYTSLVENAEIQVDYEEAFRIVKEGLAPLGEQYGKLLQEAHDNGWIDVEETEGKRSGAYSISVFGLKHPYVLLNYQKTTGDVFTVAHELQHSFGVSFRILYFWFSINTPPIFHLLEWYLLFVCLFEILVYLA